jgi:hypothetical protein
MLTYSELKQLLALNTKLLLNAQAKGQLTRQAELLIHRAEVKSCLIDCLESHLKTKKKRHNAA